MIQRLCFFIVLFLVSCQDVKLPEAPVNLIDKSTMIDVLSESYLMNAARSIANRNVVNKGIKLDSIIYNKYAIDSLQFAQSNAYYSSDIEVYEELILEVQKKLVHEKSLRDSLFGLYKKTQAAIKVQDSIDNVRLDSLRIVSPKVSRDSLEKQLEIIKTIERKRRFVGLDVESVESN